MTTQHFSEDELARMLRTRADRVAPLGLEEDILAAIHRERAERTARPARDRPSRALFLVAAALVVGAGLVTVLGSGSRQRPSVELSPTDTESAALVSAFLEARVAGSGADPYLGAAAEEVPLLYATRAGRSYERAEFERVQGIEWPYGWIAFKARLFAADIVVEQLLFVSQDGRPFVSQDGRPQVQYQEWGFGTDIAPTTEDGQPLAMPYHYFDDVVTVHAAHPWIFHDGWEAGRLIPEGPGVPPTTDGGERGAWDLLVLKADPYPVGTGCVIHPARSGAQAIADSIQANTDLQATAPAQVTVGRSSAQTTDVVIAPGATLCDGDGVAGLDGSRGTLVVDGLGLRPGHRMRLYLLDLEEGSSMQVLAIAIIAQESTFERAVEAAAPILDSIQVREP